MFYIALYLKNIYQSVYLFDIYLQKCGIESLVDELCEKLKDFKSSSENKENKLSKDGSEQPELIDSPLDLAKRYYAAFPPLKSGSNIITLIPHIYNKKKSGETFVSDLFFNCRILTLRPFDKMLHALLSVRLTPAVLFPVSRW